MKQVSRTIRANVNRSPFKVQGDNRSIPQLPDRGW